MTGGRGRGADDGGRRARARRLPRRGVAGRIRPRRRARRARREPALGDRPAARARRRASGAHVGQGRSRSAALAAPRGRGAGRGLHRHRGWLAEQWQAVLGMPVPARSADFFDLGGGSLAAAQLVSRIRTRVPGFSVADIYDVPRLGAMAKALGRSRDDDDAVGTSVSPSRRRGPPSGCRRSSVSRCSSSPASAGCSICSPRARCCTSCPASRCSRPRRCGCSSSGCWSSRRRSDAWRCRWSSPALLLAGLKPGDYPRGGATHLRLWLAEQVADQVDAVGLAGAPWVTYYARALGAKIGRDVDLHTLPPITGHARDRRPRGDRARGRPPRLLDRRRPASHRRRPHRRRRHDRRAEHARPGHPHRAAGGDRTRLGRVRTRARRSVWAGSPAARVGGVAEGWPAERPPQARRGCGHTPRPRPCSACCRSPPSRSAAS